MCCQLTNWKLCLMQSRILLHPGCFLHHRTTMQLSTLALQAIATSIEKTWCNKRRRPLKFYTYLCVATQTICHALQMFSHSYIWTEFLHMGYYGSKSLKPTVLFGTAPFLGELAKTCSAEQRQAVSAFVVLSHLQFHLTVNYHQLYISTSGSNCLTVKQMERF